jgi:hypothetical protein
VVAVVRCRPHGGTPSSASQNARLAAGSVPGHGGEGGHASSPDEVDRGWTQDRLGLLAHRVRLDRPGGQPVFDVQRTRTMVSRCRRARSAPRHLVLLTNDTAAARPGCSRIAGAAGLGRPLVAIPVRHPAAGGLRPAPRGVRRGVRAVPGAGVRTSPRSTCRGRRRSSSAIPAPEERRLCCSTRATSSRRGRGGVAVAATEATSDLRWRGRHEVEHRRAPGR